MKANFLVTLITKPKTVLFVPKNQRYSDPCVKLQAPSQTLIPHTREGPMKYTASYSNEKAWFMLVHVATLECTSVLVNFWTSVE